jgi:hypothetical protein
MQYKYILVIALLTNLTSYGQNAIKHSKQQTSFFYTLLNLHAGYVNDYDKGRFDLTNHSPDNQLAFNLFSKNQNVLQKGYIKKFSLVSYNIRISTPFHKSIDSSGYHKGNLSLKILDTWAKFDTKWDRTSVWIGNKSIPYGHNPKLDPVSTFMTNITKMDIGFVQDLGVFVKTPVSKGLDLELSLTSGGFLNKPLATYDHLIHEDPSQDLNPIFSFSDYSYQDTWLITSRVGTPTFKKNEFGVILASGNVISPLNDQESIQINRLGGDWIYKYYEKLKWSNQLVLGYNHTSSNNSTSSIHFQTGMDYYLLNNFFISTSFAYTNFMASEMERKNYISATSFTYTFSPHTRLRLNQYFSSKSATDNKQWGIMLQFVTGFGKRP